MAKSKVKKIRPTTQSTSLTDQVFWVSLEEARRTILDNYDYLAEKMDRQKRKTRN